MKRRALPLLFFLLMSLASFAQTTYTWNGSTDSSQELALATIDNQPSNEATGYSGDIQITNGNFLWLLDLPQSLGFPNNGYLDCQTAITWGAKQWGTRANGSQMDGTQAGDYYTLTGTTVCPLWNGTTDVSLTEYREMIQHRSCRYSVCRTYLVDTEENGWGSAKVQ